MIAGNVGVPNGYPLQVALPPLGDIQSYGILPSPTRGKAIGDGEQIDQTVHSGELRAWKQDDTDLDYSLRWHGLINCTLVL
ncbi:hypothetical protein [Cupriavidus sp. RAF12]|uniref:hypothetical protein n=1 Tax=Cupriavidus sp. RAF12 TaxID=3233050 RepID=UPI003F9278E1